MALKSILPEMKTQLLKFQFKKSYILSITSLHDYITSLYDHRSYPILFQTQIYSAHVCLHWFLQIPLGYFLGEGEDKVLNKI